MQIKLQDKVAMITGGSRGIGRATSLALAQAGAAVVINYRGNQAAADELVQMIEKTDGRAVAVQADVSQAEDVERLFKRCMETFGRLDILVNNAGVTRDTLLLRMKETDFDTVINTNLRGTYLCTRAALRPMTKARGGRIINISSVVGLIGNAGQANYSAAKAGLIGFTKATAREMASRQITVNAIAPGYVDTEMTSGLGDQIKAAILENVPLGRLGTPEDIAGVVCFLASDMASYITGQTIVVDGGMVMQ